MNEKGRDHGKDLKKISVFIQHTLVKLLHWCSGQNGKETEELQCGRKTDKLDKLQYEIPLSPIMRE